MASKAPAAPKQSTEVVNYQAELAALTQRTVEAEKPSGNFVSFRAGQLMINGTRMKDDKVEVVVVHSIFENQYYKERFNPNQLTSPVCYAFSETDEELAPHKDSSEPQAKTCAECPKNVWGSDPDGGKGKACKNTRRIAMIAAPDLDKIGKAEIALAKLPVTSVKNWSTYASQIANALKLPPLGVVTEISVVPDPATQLKVHFRYISKVDEAHLPALIKLNSDVRPLINAPYDKPSDQPAAAPRKF